MIFFLLYAKHLIIFWLGCTAVFVVVFFLLTTTESSRSGQWKSQNQQILLWITNFLMRYLLRFTSNLYSIFSLQTSVLCKVSIKTRSFSPHKMYFFFCPLHPHWQWPNFKWGWKKNNVNKLKYLVFSIHKKSDLNHWIKNITLSNKAV